MTGRILQFPGRRTSSSEALAAADAVLALPVECRAAASKSLGLEDPEVLLAVCGRLRERLESSPAKVRDDADFFYNFLLDPTRPIGLFDEREYFLGELALLAATSSRMLAKRDEARRWFDRAEANFRLTVNAVADWSRVAYQRLALLVEERRFEELFEQLPTLAESFRKLDMVEDAVKCRFLEAIAYTETERLAEAVTAYQEICDQAARLGNDRLLAIVHVNLVVVLGALGARDEALSHSRQALPLLERLGDRVNLAKVKQGIGAMLRAERRSDAAIEAYREAQQHFVELSMPADVAASRLIVADLLLDKGEEEAATHEILLALPVIEEYHLVPEGVAALSLLRESLRQQKVNHQALRNLHGFFEDSVS
jgi:tetratricopeptide (TPR) repeat protein